jgi:hypothetical protein
LRDELIRKTSGMRALTIEELNSSYDRLGTIHRKQIDKRVLRRSRGLWAAVAFKFLELDSSTGEWTPRVMLATFKKLMGFFTRYSYFNIRNKEEAQQVCDLLKEWWDL